MDPLAAGRNLPQSRISTPMSCSPISAGLERGYQTKRRLISFTLDGLVFEGLLRDWVTYQLSEMWRNNLPIKACVVFSALFIRSRIDKKYCNNGSCAQMSSKGRTTRNTLSVRHDRERHHPQTKHSPVADHLSSTLDPVEEYGYAVFDVCDRYEFITRHGGNDLDMDAYGAVLALMRGEPLTKTLELIDDSHPGAEDVREALKALPRYKL